MGALSLSVSVQYSRCSMKSLIIRCPLSEAEAEDSWQFDSWAEKQNISQSCHSGSVLLSVSRHFVLGQDHAWDICCQILRCSSATVQLREMDTGNNMFGHK